MPSAYHQIHMPEEYQDRLSFVTQWGTFKYKRLMFGMRNAASYFQALIDSIIEETNMSGIFSYQDDIILCTNSLDETLQKLEALLSVFIRHNLTINLKKCNFHSSTVNFLGFKIMNKKVFPLQSNIKKITAFPQPKTPKQIKKFIGLCSFYRNLIPNFAEVAHPLIKLTSTKSRFVWNQEQQMAFVSLQNIFFKEPFLQQPNFEKKFFLNTDASAVAIGAVLLQEFEGQLLPVAYYSRTLKQS